MCDYFREALDEQRKSVVARTCRAIKKAKVQHIAVRGVSGISIGAIVAYKLNLNLIVSRKSESHAGKNLATGQTPMNGETYAIIDDFISTGETVKLILNDIERAYPYLKCAGFYGYKNNWNWNAKQMRRYRSDYRRELCEKLKIRLLNTHLQPKLEYAAAKPSGETIKLTVPSDSRQAYVTDNPFAWMARTFTEDYMNQWVNNQLQNMKNNQLCSLPSIARKA